MQGIKLSYVPLVAHAISDLVGVLNDLDVVDLDLLGQVAGVAKIVVNVVRPYQGYRVVIL